MDRFPNKEIEIIIVVITGLTIIINLFILGLECIAVIFSNDWLLPVSELLLIIPQWMLEAGLKINNSVLWNKLFY